MQGNFTNPHLEMNIRFFNAGFIGIASWQLEKGLAYPEAGLSMESPFGRLIGYVASKSCVVVIPHFLARELSPMVSKSTVYCQAV
jgi:hypothetical protein